MRRAIPIAALLTLFTSASFAAEITGRVVERAQKGERPVGNQSVRLQILRGESDLQWAETKTSADGSFRFRNLVPDREHIHVVHLDYQGVPFSALPVRFSETDRTIPLPPFRVYPAVGKPDRVEANEKLVIASGRGDSLKLIETITFVNRGDRTYTPRAQGGVPIEISLIRGGFGLELLEGFTEDSFDIDSSGNTLLLKKPIPPGDENRLRIRFAYSLPYETRNLSLSFRANIARSGLDLILTGGPSGLSSLQLHVQPTAPQGKNASRVYSGGPFPAGEIIRAELTGLWPANHVGFLFVSLGILAVFVSAVFLWFRGNRKGSRKGS
ncbi:MAG: carboxypeptidase-like regulatory domain-containing protein [Pseudomonadota bacterium]